MKHYTRYAVLIASLATLGACTNRYADGGPMPQLTFANMAPVQVDAGKIDFILNTDRAADPADVSSRFVMNPVEALRRYTAQRYVAAGSGQTLRIVVEESSVHVREIPQKNKTLQWADIGTEDEYEVNMIVRAVPVSYGGQEGTSMQWKYRRTLVMPQSVSLAERESRQLAFLEKLIADIDASMMEGLKGDMNMVR